MRKSLGLISTVAFGALLAACSNNTAEIAKMGVKGGAYEQGLHKGYLKLAVDEHAEDDWSDAEKFENRAKLAAMGNPTAPEMLSARPIPKEHQKAIGDGYKRLTGALGRGGAKSAGIEAAAAQTAFDCWMQEAEENTQPAHIVACRKDFDAAMARREGALGAAPVKVAEKKMMKKKKARKPQTVRYVMYFDFNSARLTKSGKNALDVIKSDVKKGAVVSLAGYTDRSGTEKYNDILAAKRARTVVMALKNVGLKNKVVTSVHGEKQNAVQTKDGVPHRLNRRVELSVTQ